MSGSEWCFDLGRWVPSVGDHALVVHDDGAISSHVVFSPRLEVIGIAAGVVRAYWRPPNPPDLPSHSCEHGLHDLTSTVEDKDGNEFAACSQCEFVATKGE